MRPVKTIVVGTAMIALWIGEARAQPTPPGNSTVVHLSATGSVQTAPDELVADLVAGDVAVRRSRPEARQHAD
jgi:hypothetical protein